MRPEGQPSSWGRLYVPQHHKDPAEAARGRYWGSGPRRWMTAKTWGILVHSMPTRLEEVILREGGTTKYNIYTTLQYVKLCKETAFLQSLYIYYHKNRRPINFNFTDCECSYYCISPTCLREFLNILNTVRGKLLFLITTEAAESR
jgi:hypothetical protein